MGNAFAGRHPPRTPPPLPHDMRRQGQRTHRQTAQRQLTASRLSKAEVRLAPKLPAAASFALAHAVDFVKLPLAKARGLGACRTALWDSRRCHVGNSYSIPGLAPAFSTVSRATRSAAKSDVGKGKAPPSRRFKSVRCRSQERLRTCPSISRLDRIETTTLDVPRQKGGIQIPPDTRSVRKLVIPLPQRFFSRTSHQRGRTGTGTCCAL
jgi:hypothetical protein